MRKIDFRNLIDELENTKDLKSGFLGVQTKHPAMQKLFEILAYNLMDDGEQGIYDDHIYQGGSATPRAAFAAFKEQGGANHVIGIIKMSTFGGEN